MVRGKPGAWDAQVCLAWGDSVLSWLRSELSRGSETPRDAGDGRDGRDVPTVWRASFTAGEGVRLVNLGEEDVKDVEGGEERVGFLPRWFWEEETGEDGKIDRLADNGKSAEAPVPVTGDKVVEEGKDDDASYKPTVSSVAASGWKI